MKPSEILAEAKALISDPERWTMKFLARNKVEREVDPTSAPACKWCVAGAVIKIANIHRVDEEKVLRILRRATLDWKLHGQEGSPAILNDRGNHAEVMKLLDRAIELAKEKEL